MSIRNKTALVFAASVSASAISLISTSAFAEGLCDCTYSASWTAQGGSTMNQKCVEAHGKASAYTPGKKRLVRADGDAAALECDNCSSSVPLACVESVTGTIEESITVDYNVMAGVTYSEELEAGINGVLSARVGVAVSVEYSEGKSNTSTESKARSVTCGSADPGIPGGKHVDYILMVWTQPRTATVDYWGEWHQQRVPPNGPPDPWKYDKKCSIRTAKIVSSQKALTARCSAQEVDCPDKGAGGEGEKNE